MKKWRVIVRFRFPDSTREQGIEVEAETKQQAIEIAAHMGREMTRHPNITDPADVDYFDRVLVAREKEK